MQNEKSYWNKWYTGVIVFLVLQVVLYYLITSHYKEIAPVPSLRETPISELPGLFPKSWGNAFIV